MNSARSLALILCLTLAGCARGTVGHFGKSDWSTPAATPAPAVRYLTVDEDAKVRDICEPAGCITIPLPVWEMIERALQGGEAI